MHAWPPIKAFSSYVTICAQNQHFQGQQNSWQLGDMEIKRKGTIGRERMKAKVRSRGR